MILWTYDPPERDARLANEALKSRRKNTTQLRVIVEIACATSPHHLVAVRQAYCSLFDSSLEEDIISNVSLPLQKVGIEHFLIVNHLFYSCMDGCWTGLGELGEFLQV